MFPVSRTKYDIPSAQDYSSGPLSQASAFPDPYRARHSDYVPSQSRFADPDNQMRGETSKYVDDFFRAPDRQDFSRPQPQPAFASYLKQLPFWIQDYVTGIQNVSGDGNCGFRALAVAMGLPESTETFEYVRTEMLAEYDSKKPFYDGIFGAVDGLRIYTLLRSSYPNGGRPVDKWMSMPQCPILLANRLGLIINCLSPTESSTVFPFWKGPGEILLKEPISIALIMGGSHYVMVQLQGNYPMAYVTPFGNTSLTAPAAASWAEIYQPRVDLFHELITPYKRAPFFADLTSKSDL